MLIKYQFKPHDRAELFEKQYYIGQGGLHLGVLAYPTSYKDYVTDVYIYDCGAYIQKNIYHGIDELVKDLKKCKKINNVRVFISHFHDDHVNGLDYLYKKLKESISYAYLELILPSISEYEKIFMLGHYYDKNSSNDFGYEKFIINPSEYFNGKYNVMFLTNEQYPKQNHDVIYDKPVPFDKNKISDFHDYVFRNTAYNEIIWIYKTYFYPLDSKNLELLKTEIENAQINLSNATKEKRTEVREIYNKYYNNINESSICLYSGPINKNIIGWMHTGDIKLKKNILEEFNKKYNDIIDNILIFQIPHHGSCNNSNKSDLKKIQNVLFYYLTTQNRPNHNRKNPKVAQKFKDAIKVTEITSEKIFIFFMQNNNLSLPYK